MLGAEMTNLTGVKVTISDQTKRERYHAMQNELQITICTNQTDKALVNTRCPYQWLFQFYLCKLSGFLSRTKRKYHHLASFCLYVMLFPLLRLDEKISNFHSKTTMENPNRSSPPYNAVQFY
ncbi:hypothetical protein T02_12103 [Trichinella nativa]|uniref:Uncharacterized protein n=1 Tax=Trichinella nativa TaxID=6335 RepID=A0A0V1L054_9BILA|nr:hypothetical protein T02_12103 [Trichinella nativa]